MTTSTEEEQLRNKFDSHFARLEELERKRLAKAAAVYRDRRERIATAAMAALLSKPIPSYLTDQEIAAFAVIAADALIAELDKPKEVQP